MDRDEILRVLGAFEQEGFEAPVRLGRWLMGVEKFRSGEAMNAAPVMSSEDQGFERFISHCARYRRISPLDLPRGVFKFRSVAEAQDAPERVGKNTSP